jgi:hypothetical protein
MSMPPPRFDLFREARELRQASLQQHLADGHRNLVQRTSLPGAIDRGLANTAAAA